MKKEYYYLSLVLITNLFLSCGGENIPTEDFSKATNETISEVKEDSKYSAGEAVYNKTCIACHQADGNGMEGAFPPLAGSDYLMKDKNRAIAQVIHGSEGEITVNGKVYSGIMPPQVITDQEVKDVINYILNSWGNDGGEVTIEEVQLERGAE
ncbi:MAG: cytochrome c [Crocinitomicaceae bacterium]